MSDLPSRDELIEARAVKLAKAAIRSTAIDIEAKIASDAPSGSSSIFELPYRKSCTWHYCYGSGKGGLRHDQCVVAFPNDWEDADKEQYLESRFGPFTPDFRGFTLVKLS